MILNELLGQVEILTDIVLYESSSEHWDDTKETLIKKDITVADYYSNREKELYDKYSRCEIIGITIEKNALRITVYKGRTKNEK